LRDVTKRVGDPISAIAWAAAGRSLMQIKVSRPRFA
jgi:hypothetical protein